MQFSSVHHLPTHRAAMQSIVNAALPRHTGELGIKVVRPVFASLGYRNNTPTRHIGSGTGFWHPQSAKRTSWRCKWTGPEAAWAPWQPCSAEAPGATILSNKDESRSMKSVQWHGSKVGFSIILLVDAVGAGACGAWRAGAAVAPELGKCHAEWRAHSTTLRACCVAICLLQDVRVKEVPVPMVTDPQARWQQAACPALPCLQLPLCLPAGRPALPPAPHGCPTVSVLPCALDPLALPASRRTSCCASPPHASAGQTCTCK